MFGKKKGRNDRAVIVSPDGKTSLPLSTARFNWGLFLSSSVFGYPLLRLRLWDWAAGMFVLSSADIWLSVKKLTATWEAALNGDLAALDGMKESNVEHLLSGALLIGSVWLGLYGYKLCCLRLMRKGWRFINPDGEAAQKAIEIWHIPRPFTGKRVVRRRIGPHRHVPSDRL